jgi:transposase-like protein
MIEALRKAIKWMHYPLEMMLTCVRWYVAYPLSLRHIEEMMAERDVFVDHATVHRWSVKILPALAKVFRRTSARWARAGVWTSVHQGAWPLGVSVSGR